MQVWADNVVLVKKKDCCLRCCIDYRQMNSVTGKDAYPLPRIDASLDAMPSKSAERDTYSLQCSDAVGWVTRRAPGL